MTAEQQRQKNIDRRGENEMGEKTQEINNNVKEIFRSWAKYHGNRSTEWQQLPFFLLGSSSAAEDFIKKCDKIINFQ